MLRALAAPARQMLRRAAAPSQRAYHQNVVEHYENPRNVGACALLPGLLLAYAPSAPSPSSHAPPLFPQPPPPPLLPGSLDKADKLVGTGLVGAPACGDVMKLQIKVGEDGRIVDAKFKTFGCGSAIASSSVATEWVKGKTVDECLAIKNTDIAAHLKLPPVKLHCSMLAEDAIKAAIADYKSKK